MLAQHESHHVPDCSAQRGKEFTNRDQDLLISWTRRARPGDVLQLTLFIMTRVIAKKRGGLEGLVELDSIDMVSLAEEVEKRDTGGWG